MGKNANHGWTAFAALRRGRQTRRYRKTIGVHLFANGDDGINDIEKLRGKQRASVGNERVSKFSELAPAKP